MSLDRKIYELFRQHRLDSYLKIDGKEKLVGAETVRILLYDRAGKILFCTGVTKPADLTAGYAKGCIFVDTDAAGGVNGFYVNTGTITSCAFQTGAVAAPGDITLADGKIIVGSALGAGAAQTMGGDATIINDGTLTIGNTKITFAKMQNVDAYSVPVRAGVGAGVLDEVAVTEGKVLGRATGGNVAAIEITNEHVSATAAIVLSKLAALLSGRIIVGSAGNVPTAVVMGGDASIVADGTITVGDNKITNAKLAAMAIGTVKVGGPADEPTDVEMGTGTLLTGNTGTIPTALGLAANEVLYKPDGLTLDGLALARKKLLTGGATQLQAIAVAAGDIVSANANDIAVVPIAAGEVVVGATGPVIDGVALATGSILIGVSGATPTALDIAVNEVLYRVAAGTLDGLALTRLQLLKGGATQLEAMSVAVGNIVTATATDVAVVAIAPGEIVVGITTTGAIDGVALPTGSILQGVTDATPTALDIAVNEVLYRTAAGPLDGLALTRLQLLKGGATQLAAMSVAAGQIVTADATDVITVAIGAGEVVVGAAGPVVDGVALATGSILIGVSGTTPVALDLAVNEVLYRIAAGTLDGLALPAGSLLTGGATQLEAVAIAAGEVAVGATGTVIDGVALATGSILIGATNATPVALDLAVNEVLYRIAAGTLDGLALTRLQLLKGGAANLEAISVAAGQVVSANATDVVTIAIAAGEVMVGAAGPVIDGVPLATGSILIGATAATPVALDIGVNEVLYRISGGTLDGLSVPRKSILTGGAANLQAINVVPGDLVTADANDLAVVNIAPGKVVVGATGSVIDGVALADNTILTGATNATPVALAVAASRVVGRTAAGVLDDIQIDSDHVIQNAIDPEHLALRTYSTDATDGDITISAAALKQGYFEKTGVVGAHNMNLGASAAAVIALMGSTAYSWFECLIVNNSDATATLVAADGSMTLKGTATIPTLKTARVVFVKTAAGTLDAVITVGA